MKKLIISLFLLTSCNPFEKEETTINESGPAIPELEYYGSGTGNFYFDLGDCFENSYENFEQIGNYPHTENVQVCAYESDDSSVQGSCIEYVGSDFEVTNLSTEDQCSVDLGDHRLDASCTGLNDENKIIAACVQFYGSSDGKVQYYYNNFTLEDDDDATLSEKITSLKADCKELCTESLNSFFFEYE